MYRMNVGTIVEADMLKVRLVRSRASKLIPRGGRLLGQVEEYFIETLTPGDTFVFAGEVLKYEALVEDEAYVSRSNDPDPKVPSYEGGKFPLSTYLADRVRGILADHHTWRALPRRFANGSKCRNFARVFRESASFWSKRFRAPRSTTSSAIRSRGALRIRRSACC
jgi:Lhr-like helicase